ncbi:MAG: molybdopterin cofactor-binding domain-containing protein [Spirochaetales bacterium]
MQKKKTKKTFTHTSTFYSDLANEETLYAVLVRSPIENGTIRSVSHPQLPDGYSLFTAENIPQKNSITVLDVEFPVFARETVSYKGEPIGILTGDNLATLQTLCEELQIVFTEIFSDEDAAKKTNKNTVSRHVRYGNYTKARNAAEFHIEHTYTLTPDIIENFEPNGAFCYTAGKKLTVYCPTQWVSNVRKNLVSVIGYESENIYIHKTNVPLTESHAPWKTSTLTVQCAVAAMLTGKPVMLCLTKVEQTMYNDYRPVISVSHNTATDAEGTILADKITVNLDVGAYNPFVKILVDRLTIASLHAYKIKNADITVTAQTSHNPPTTLFLRRPDYHCFFASENHLHEIARVTGLNPAEIHIRNLPEKNESLFEFDTANLKNALHTVLQKSDFYRKYTAYTLNPYTDESMQSYFPLRGIGLATAYEANGFVDSVMNLQTHRIEISMEINGAVIIKAPTPSDTTGFIWKTIASEILAVDIGDIIIDSTLLYNEEADLPETMLNNISIMTELVKKVCLSIQKMRFHNPLPIKVSRTFTPGRKKTWDNETFTGCPYYATSWIATVAEVEADIPTYAYAVRNIWITIDAGSILHKEHAILAIKNSVHQILSGTPKTTLNMSPNIYIDFIPSSEAPKQIRELVFSALPAALTAAVSQILQEQITEFPVDRNTIYKITEKINTDVIHKDSASPKNEEKEG